MPLSFCRPLQQMRSLAPCLRQNTPQTNFSTYRKRQFPTFTFTSRRFFASEPPAKPSTTPSSNEQNTSPAASNLPTHTAVSSKPSPELLNPSATPRPITNSATGLASLALGGEEAPPSSGTSAPNSSTPPRQPPGHTEEKSHAGTVLLTVIAGGLVGVVASYGRPDEKIPEQTWSPIQLIQRTYKRARDYYDYLQQPVFDVLLPEELPEPYQQPYTLVINLDETLIRSEWDIRTGWRVAKRPGVDYFLAYLAQHFELVLFTSQPSMNAEPIVQKLDPYEYILYKLYRDSTKKIDGKHVKDLSMLNRDLKKVIMLDSNPESYRLQPENAIPVKPWDGSSDDDWLVGIIPFLEAIAFSQPGDVRPILQYWADKPNIPQAYAEFEEKLRQQQMEEWRIQQEQTKPKRGLASLFSSTSISNSPTSDQPPPLYLDQMRRQTQDAFKQQQIVVQEQSIAQKQLQKEIESKIAKDFTLWRYMTEGPPQISPEMIAEQQALIKEQQEKEQQKEV